MASGILTVNCLCTYPLFSSKSKIFKRCLSKLDICNPKNSTKKLCVFQFCNWLRCGLVKSYDRVSLADQTNTGWGWVGAALNCSITSLHSLSNGNWIKDSLLLLSQDSVQTMKWSRLYQAIPFPQASKELEDSVLFYPAWRGVGSTEHFVMNDQVLTFQALQSIVNLLIEYPSVNVLYYH